MGRLLHLVIGKDVQAAIILQGFSFDVHETSSPQIVRFFSLK